LSTTMTGFKNYFEKNKWEAGCWWVTFVILATWKAEIRRIMVWDLPVETVHKTLISKITKAKWTGSVAQLVECLLCKREALSSKPSLTDNKKSKWEEKEEEEEREEEAEGGGRQEEKEGVWPWGKLLERGKQVTQSGWMARVE
jgi:hypothetical protein